MRLAPRIERWLSARERGGVILDARLEFGGGDDAVDEADRQRLGRRDAAAAEQQILGARRADERDQAARLDRAVDEAELGRRRRQIRVVGGEAQVAAQRHREPAADRRAFDRGDRRPVERGERASSAACIAST